nr:MAG TPA: Protein of unknown function (DUF1492) [Caudoviricetes sp.]
MIMTYKMVNELLQTLRAKRSRADRIIELMKKLESDAGAIGSALAPKVPTGNNVDSKVERLAIKIAETMEQYRKALEEYYAIEDKLTEVIEKELTGEERDIIVSHYILGVSFRRLAVDMHYGEKTIRRRADSAKRKIAKRLKL